MHKYFFALLLLAGTACKGQDQNGVAGLSGAYQLLSQSLQGNSVDTTFTERKQLKIYTDHYMMYVRLNPEDSVSSFGVGTFYIKNGRLTEHMIYSASDNTENTNSFSGTVNISKRLKGYEQVIPEIRSDKGKVRLTEDYQLLGTGLRSPCDGTWRLTVAYTINGKDTLRRDAVKYMTFYKGNFSTGSFNTGSPGKKRTMVEYGTFRTIGKNKLKENITCSTMSLRKGRSYDLDIFIKGNGSLTTTASYAAGSEEVEKYTRMK